MSSETATRLNPHTGLPAVRVGTHAAGGHYTVWDYVQHQQRGKWREQWARMDDDDCNQSHYKHYEWQLRHAIDELEVREEQLRKAIAFLSPKQLETICPKPTMQKIDTLCNDGPCDNCGETHPDARDGK